MTENVGSPLYQAPEMLETGKYSKMADLWSVGIILYNMLTGCDPFSGDSDQEINEHVLFDEIDFSCIENVKMKEFCEGLLDKNPEFRLSAKRALKLAYEIYDSFINDVEMEENKNNFNNLDNKNLGYLTMDQIKMKYKINTENMFCQNCLNFDDFSYMIKNKLIIAI
jgi:serine/threonine protein kinase